MVRDLVLSVFLHRVLIVNNPSTDPYFNLAAEEYLLKNFDEDIFMLWRNENTIVVGKHQNARAEINTAFVEQQGVKVARRLSGGGTVFHDAGNLNFTFIGNARDNDEIKVDFAYFTRPVIDVLATLGLQATLSGRNDLLIDGFKFSGNAEHIYRQKKRTLHHGTLLYNSRIADLSAALKVDPLKYTDKAVKSFRSKVTNISEHMQEPMDIEVFHAAVVNYMKELYDDTSFYKFTENDIVAINKLRDEKYATWEWIFGYSPRYTFNNFIISGPHDLSLGLSVDKGIILTCEVSGASPDIEQWKIFEGHITGQVHSPDTIREALKALSLYGVGSLTGEEVVMAWF